MCLRVSASTDRTVLVACYCSMIHSSVLTRAYGTREGSSSSPLLCDRLARYPPKSKTFPGFAGTNCPGSCWLCIDFPHSMSRKKSARAVQNVGNLRFLASGIKGKNPLSWYKACGSDGLARLFRRAKSIATPTFVVQMHRVKLPCSGSFRFFTANILAA